MPGTTTVTHFFLTRKPLIYNCCAPKKALSKNFFKSPACIESTNTILLCHDQGQRQRLTNNQIKNGSVVQLVRIPACHAGGRGFESRPDRQQQKDKPLIHSELEAYLFVRKNIGKTDQFQKGQYTNFDVSEQRQRAQFYPILIGVISLMTVLLFATNQPRPFCYGTACALLLVVSSYGVNRYIKASLHTSLSSFLTWAIYSINQPLGLMMGGFSILIGASRLVLGRHTLLEILVGALIGLIAGTGLYGVAGLT